jgi:aspartyl-tRNA(Asn)/glutamyl-tRNA(Gln) amidotransferase subunit A
VTASPLDGLPVSVKDLFDVAGQTTAAGAAILRAAPPARHDADVVARLRAAGAVLIGRTQMSEFAFTGLGLNPHWPQPPNPAAPDRVTGGSSGGAAVSVALGQAAAGLGSDTGGSVRIPAAFCGLAGFKPTQRRISRNGAFPLSTTLDSIGPIAWSIDCCRRLDAILADAPAAAHPAVALKGLRIGVPEGYLLDDMDEVVAGAFDRALSSLADRGAAIVTFGFPELSSIPAMNARGTISNAEAFAHHRRTGLLGRRREYDPNVLARVELGAELGAADYLDLLDARRKLIDAADHRMAAFDAVVAPTVPIQAPTIEQIGEPATFARLNGLTLRNPSVVNLLDRCAASVPMQSDGAPAGLMIVGQAMGDSRLLAVAEAIEPAVR